MTTTEPRERYISCAGSEADILLVDDNPGDIRLTKELFAEADLTNPIHAVTTGQEAIDFVQQRGKFADEPQPDLLLLDWHLSRMDGEQVLQQLDETATLEGIFTMILTGSTRKSEFVVPSELDVDGYLRKPVDPDEFCSVIRTMDKISLSIEIRD